MKYLSTLVLLASTAAAAPQTKAARQACSLPSSFKWKDSGILAQPKNGNKSLKDFTTAPINGKHIVYATHYGSNWGSTMLAPVSSFSELGNAAQSVMSFSAVAPSLIYFTPKSTWVLAYQWGPTSFSYRTSKDPTNLSGWGGVQTLSTGKVNSGTGAIDQAIIGDDEKMYLFFCGDNGKIYRQSMALSSFPSSFGDKYDTIMSDSTNNLFEAVQVYTIKGEKKYLMLVEAVGSGGRFFRSFTATSLGGSWTPLAASESNPFAGKKNSGASWTNDISHGELVRTDASEKNNIDPCNLQLLYQGRSPSSGGDYNSLPYRPGLLTMQK